MQNVALLLLCPALPHFLWVGKQFDRRSAGIATDSEAAWVQWASGVAAGEVKFDGAVGRHLAASSLRVERSGEESEAFWAAFNEGY